MRIPFLRFATILVCTLTTLPVFAQDLPSIPPTLDPRFWGRPNEPFALTLIETTFDVNASNTPQTHIMKLNLYRDSAGRERTEGFYDKGLPNDVTIRDPGNNSRIFWYVATKRGYIVPPLPPGKGWTVQRLQPRVVAGLPAEGLRFTRTIPASVDGAVPSVTMTDEEWISNELGIVLEQTTIDPRTYKMTKTVTQLKKVEPDPALFVIPANIPFIRLGWPAP